MWHFVDKKHQKQQGPVSKDELKTLIDNNFINSSTLVWKTGMDGWSIITDTELKGFFTHDTPPPIPIRDSYNSLEPPPIPIAEKQINFHHISVEIEQLETWFKIYWIGLAAGIPLCVVIVGFFAVFTSWIFSLMMLHKFWKIIQDSEVSTTPDKAIGFLFIPCFNFYWLFVAFWGLAKDINKYVEKRNIRAPKINEDLVLAYCIISCVSLFSLLAPQLWFVFMIPILVMWIIIFRGFKQSTVAILKSKFRAAL